MDSEKIDASTKKFDKIYNYIFDQILKETEVEVQKKSKNGESIKISGIGYSQITNIALIKTQTIILGELLNDIYSDM